MRISDWSSDVCSSDLSVAIRLQRRQISRHRVIAAGGRRHPLLRNEAAAPDPGAEARRNALAGRRQCLAIGQEKAVEQRQRDANRSEEHKSELQSLMRISYAVFCLKKKTQINAKV